MNRLDAIILAGGLGTRLRDALPGTPKSLAPVCGRPFLDILLEFLDRASIARRVVIAVGHMAEQIIERYGRGKEYDFDICFSIEKELLGTGGAIKKALQYVDTEDILCLNGDSFVDVDLRDVLNYHEKHGAAMTIVAREVENTGRYGTIILADDKRIMEFNEKRGVISKGYINAGIYLFKRCLFHDIEEKKVSLEKEIMPIFCKDKAYGYVATGRFIDIGDPETYKIAQEYLVGV